MRKFRAVPGKGIVAGKVNSSSSMNKRKRIVANHDFDWATYGPDSDPADWYIDYDGFFEAIEANIIELGLEVVDYHDKETYGGRICTYELSNGSSLDSYDLEIAILYALDDRTIRNSQTDEFIKNYIKKNCM